MTMNQLVNIPIKSCRMHAGKGDKEAQNMWHMWNQMVISPPPLPPPLFPNLPFSQFYLFYRDR